MKLTKRALLVSVASYLFSKYWERRKATKNQYKNESSESSQTDESLTDVIMDKVSASAKRWWSQAVLKADKVVNKA